MNHNDVDDDVDENEMNIFVPSMPETAYDDRVR